MTSAIENAFKEALKKRLIGAQEVVSTISIDEKIHLDATNGEGIQNNSSAMIDFKSTTSTNDHHKLSVTKKSSFDVIYDQIGNLISQGKHFAARDLHKSNKGLITEAEFNRITRDVYGKRWVSKASVTGSWINSGFKVGDRVQHTIRRDIGVGVIQQGWSVKFLKDTFSGVPATEFFSVENKLVLSERESLRKQLLELLQAGKINEAKDLFKYKCSEWFDQDEFNHEVVVVEDRIQQQKLQELNSSLLQTIKKLLDAEEIEKADKFYEEYCAKWWHLNDYINEKANSRLVNGFIKKYQTSSLADIDEFFIENYKDVLSVLEFIELKKPLLRRKLELINITLDDEQINAVANPMRQMLVRARAGSGKTRTLCARAALSIKDEQLDPDQVLIVAFNKSAADEVRSRMRNDFGCSTFENARTFHSLAYQLAKPKKKLLFDEGRHPSQKAQSGFVQELLERILNPAFKELLYQFFRKEIEEIENIGRDLSKDEYSAFRRSLDHVSLKGERVKSAGEKFIADFLFEHDIHYTYEHIYSWNELDQGQPYKPDFTIIANGSDFILEHWALNPRDKTALLPDDWDTTADQYRQQIARKRILWADKGIRLIETHTGEMLGGREVFEDELKQHLVTAGIKCERLSDEIIIERVFKTNFHISRMSEQFMQFIQRAKKRCLNVDAAAELVSNRQTTDQRLSLFYQLSLRVYREYEEELIQRGAMDFDDLLQQATEEIERQGADATLRLGEGRFVRIGDLKWLLVDEYQDFSELYYRMLSAILNANPSIRIMAVGDDWQAINGFAGAELRFFCDFAHYFSGVGESTVATNYRSARRVVNWGNQLMDGLGPKAKPRSGALTGDTRVVDVTSKEWWVEFGKDASRAEARQKDSVYFPELPEGQSPSMTFQKLARVFKICATLYQQTKSKRLLLVSRMRRVYGLELGELRNRLVTVISQITGEDPQVLRKTIRVMTAHTSKGQEEDAMVLLDASEKNFPKIHPDNLLYEIFGVTAAEILAEEQRLFYVAITRPAEVLWILTEGNAMSPYIKKLMDPVGGILSHNVSSGVSVDPSAIYLRIKERLDALPPIHLTDRTKEEFSDDPWLSIASDVVESLKSSIEDLHRQDNVPLPAVAFDLDESGECIAELAWPDIVPPLAILVGDQYERRERWEKDGWLVISSETFIKYGAAWLADRLLLDGELPPAPERAYRPTPSNIPINNINSIGNASDISSWIAGMYFKFGDVAASQLVSVGDILDLKREPENIYDGNAILLYRSRQVLGYVAAVHNQSVAKLMDSGQEFRARVENIYGHRSTGVRIVIYKV